MLVHTLQVRVRRHRRHALPPHASANASFDQLEHSEDGHASKQAQLTTHVACATCQYTHSTRTCERARGAHVRHVSGNALSSEVNGYEAVVSDDDSARVL